MLQWKNFSWVVNENREEFLKEKQSYIDLMRERSSIFLTEANEVNLPHYPYREGFFVTLKIYDNDLCKKVHEAFSRESHLYSESKPRYTRWFMFPTKP